MSLMNDALRKKNRETTSQPVATALGALPARGRCTRKWIAVLVATILFSGASLIGVHLLQSSTGSSLLATKHSPPSRAADPSPADAHADTDLAGQTVAVDAQAPVALVEIPVPTAEIPEEKWFTGQSKEAETGRSNPDMKTRLALSASNAKVEPPAFDPVPAKTPPEQLQSRSRLYEPPPESVAQGDKSPLANARPSVPPQPPAAPSSMEKATQTKAGLAVGNTDSEDPFFKKALACHREGRLDDAARLYRQVLKAHSDHPEATLNLAAIDIEQEQFSQAMPLLERLERLTPRPDGVLLNLAIASIGTGNPEKALGYLERAEAADDAMRWEIRFHRAVALSHMDRLPEALAIYRQVAAQRPHDPALQFNLAVTCDALGLYPQALTHYEAVVQAPRQPSGTDAAAIYRRIGTIRRYLDTHRSAVKGA